MVGATRAEFVRKIIINLQEEQLTFIPPSQGPNDYQTVGRELLKRDLSLPTGEQTAYLLQVAYTSYNNLSVYKYIEPEFKEIIRIVEHNWLWVFNKNLWTPDGVYVVHDPDAVGLSHELVREEHDPDAVGLSHELVREELESMLTNGNELNGIRISQDGNVRFAPRETYRLGKHNLESLASDGFVVASYGVEGAEALREVAIAYEGKPYVYGVEVQKGQKLKQRVSALYSPCKCRAHGFPASFTVRGDIRADSKDGYAFGVCKKLKQLPFETKGLSDKKKVAY